MGKPFEIRPCPRFPDRMPINSLPPPGSYYDFMDRLWTDPDHSLYKRDKLLSSGWNRKKPDKPKGRHQKASESCSSITDSIVSRILDGKDIPFNFEARLQKLFYTVAVQPSFICGLISGGTLTVSGDGTAVHTHSNPNGHTLPCPGHTLSPQEYARVKGLFGATPQGLKSPISAIFKVRLSLFFRLGFFIDYLTLPSFQTFINKCCINFFYS